MIDPIDAAQVWGELAPVPPQVARDLGLSEEASEVLANPGLPVSAEPLFAAVALQRVATAEGTVVQFGTDFGTRICLRPPTGPVQSIPDVQSMLVRFVNADLDSFATFLLETCRARTQFPDLGDDEIDAMIEVLEQNLLAVDATAFDDPDNWWSVIFEQLRDGLL
jgi:hypothetical protein